VFGSFVREVRDSRGVSQQKLADNAGLTQSNVAAIENNRRQPSAHSLNRILVACGSELATVAEARQIFAPLPPGFFPDDDLPRGLPDDPPDEEPTINPHTPLNERVRRITAMLETSTPR